MRMADEIALMRTGRIVQRGAPYNLYNAPVDRAAAALLFRRQHHDGRVQGTLTQTRSGNSDPRELADGTEVEVVIRPQHPKIDFDRAGKGPLPTAADGTAAQARWRAPASWGAKAWWNSGFATAARY